MGSSLTTESVVQEKKTLGPLGFWIPDYPIEIKKKSVAKNPLGLNSLKHCPSRLNFVFLRECHQIDKNQLFVTSTPSDMAMWRRVWRHVWCHRYVKPRWGERQVLWIMVFVVTLFKLRAAVAAARVRHSQILKKGSPKGRGFSH